MLFLVFLLVLLHVMGKNSLCEIVIMIYPLILKSYCSKLIPIVDNKCILGSCNQNI